MPGLFWELSTEEEMDAMINRIADLVSKYQMETTAVLVLESIKPLTPAGGPLARVFVSPWLHFVGINTRQVINTLEEPKNIEKLIKILEEREKEKAALRKEKQLAGQGESETNKNEKKVRSRLRRLLPF